MERNYFPMPHDASGKDDVLVGRIRRDVSDPTGIRQVGYWVPTKGETWSVLFAPTDPTGSIVYALDRLGIEPPDAGVLRRCVGPPLRASFAALLDTDNTEAIEQAIALYRERFADVGWRENVVYDGIPDALATLSARDRPMYLCTSKPEVYARRIVALFGFHDHLRGVYGADLAGRYDDKATLLAHLALQVWLNVPKEHQTRFARLV